MLELGKSPVLTGTRVCGWSVKVGAGMEMELVALALLVEKTEGMIVGSGARVGTEVAFAELEMGADVITAELEADADADADVDTAELETDADVDTAELAPVAEVLTGAWIWPSLI